MKRKHTILKVLKTIAIVAVALCAVLFVAEKIFWVVYSQPKYSEEENQSFLQFKDSAETVNSYIIENFGHKANEDDNSIFVSQEKGRIVGLYDERHIEIPEHLHDDFNDIRNGMNQSDTDFFIDIKTDRISYGGLSSRMYVYSRNGKTPDYYFYKGDRQHPEVYSLGNNWYLLTNYKR